MTRTPSTASAAPVRERTHQRSAVLVDAQPLWLDGVERALERLSIRTVGRASSLSAASGCLADTWPDLVVAETNVDEDPNTGREWIGNVAAEFPATSIVVLSTLASEDHIAETLTRGAQAYVLKTAAVDDLIATVRQIFHRSVFFAPPAAPILHAPTPLDATRILTRRELHILRLAAEGHSNVRISRILWVTEQTVKFHLSNVYRKLDVANRTEASRWAQLNGLLEIDPAERSDQLA
jgi:DNA-binding NarL/FixJ family response regulator